MKNSRPPVANLLGPLSFSSRLRLRLFRALASCLIILPAIGQAATHQGPVEAIQSGYGSWGDHTVSEPENFSVDSNGYSNAVRVYYPEDQLAAAPALFFAVGWNVPCSAYTEFLRFFVSQGYVSVCAEYGTDPDTIGAQLKDAFTAAATRYPNRIDTSKFGLSGHSAGAGLLPSLAWDLIRNEGWGGVDGEHVFILSSAPWFDFDITDTKLADFPSGLKLILLTNEDDHGTDLRTFIDQFESIPIPDTEKDYIILRTSIVDSYTYETDHMLICTEPGYGASVYDGMDDYGPFRLLDALAEYSFNGNLDAWRLALGDGADEQIEMGALKDLQSTDDPRPVPGLGSDYPCDVDINPRRSHCADYDDELPPVVLISPCRRRVISSLQPHFAWEACPTATSYFLQLRPLLPDGNPDWDTSYGENVMAEAAGCDGGGENCALTLSSILPEGDYVWWILPSNETLDGVWSRRGYFGVETTELIFADNFESADFSYWRLP